LADLGQAREVQAIRSGFTLIGGKGRPAAIRQRTQELRSRLPEAAYGRERNRLVERAGKLQGGVALLEVGGATESEREYLKERTEEAVHVVRLGMHGGVAPGGGVAYLACVPALCALSFSDEEAPGAAILAQALAAPTRAILENSGVDATTILARLRDAGHGCGYDVMRKQFTDMMAANIVDPVKVLQVALQTGVSGALMALTTDVLVHKPRSNRDEEVDFRP
jgi:chaperonin GroEL